MDEPSVAIQPETTGKLPGGITGKGFVKGDKRINRYGRPRSHDKLRKLIQRIGGEQIEGSDLTRIEAMLRVMFASKAPADRAALLEHGWGKVKEQVELSGNVSLKTYQNVSPDDWDETDQTD